MLHWLIKFLQMVLLQGVLEAIRISCAGYPTKRSFDEFLDRFGMLAPDVLDGYKLFNLESKIFIFRFCFTSLFYFFL